MAFDSPAEHLTAELRRLTLLLHQEILRLRASYKLSLDEFRGLYISDEQVDRLVDQSLAAATPPDEVRSSLAELATRAEAMLQQNRANLPEDFPWARLVREWSLEGFEQDVLLLAMAPEFNLKFQSIYAYLNNDVARRWPTFDLALRLFAPGDTDPQRRQKLLPESTLFDTGLLQPLRSPSERASWLAGGFTIAPAAAQFILGLSAADPLTAAFTLEHPPTTWDQAPVSPDLRQKLMSLAPSMRAGTAPVLVLVGWAGAGRRAASAALCRDAGRPLLCIDLPALRAEMVRSSHDSPSRPIEALLLRCRLIGAALYLDHAESIFDKEAAVSNEDRRLLAALARSSAPLLLASEPGPAWRDLLIGRPWQVIEFPEPDFPARRQLWLQYLADSGATTSDAAIESVSSRFVLTPGQIRSAATSLARASTTEASTPDADSSVSADALTAAARAQSEQNLGSLATRLSTRSRWEDLVLPPATLQRVHDIADAVRNRHIVYGEQGFGRRFATNQGLKILFSGPSGTGKTMTAGVIAAELGLDLYRIDISGVVSKYIGETEKNIDRIFHAARRSNAIVFGDEADAIFGRRGEVNEARDKYANLETAHLLQRIEEYDGLVILASNLSKNIDDAFHRRLQYVVEFPLPDEAHRKKLWRGMFPAAAPLADDVDFAFLARQFPLSGGDIRNVVLDAAFAAAAQKSPINMRSLVQATARQMLKQGTIPSPAEFKQFYPLIGQSAGTGWPGSR